MPKPSRSDGGHRGLAHVADLEAYARAVVDGKQIACKWVRLACERHIRDRGREGADDFAYHFDERAAERACRLAELFPHVKGRWAKRDETIVLAPWQKFIVGSIFGWKRKGSGLRRFREVYLAVPRKNAKSTLAAVIGVIMFCLDGEAGAEVYAGATTQKQAWETFGPARRMLEKADDISAELGIEVRAQSIVMEDGSRFEPIIGKPGDGASPSCAIVDEYHEQLGPDLYDTMVTGMGAREQPLIVITTTAGYDISVPCFDKEAEVKRILDGTFSNEEIFGVVYTIDDKDDWTSPDALRKANPNIGVSVDEEFLLSQQRSAVVNATGQNRFRTKHLNLWSGSRAAWMNMSAWRLCEDAGLTIDDLAGEEAWLGLDLASKVDLCAMVALAKKRMGEAFHLYAFARFFVPSEALSDGPNAAAYRKWAATGHITVTDGAEVDFDQVRESALELAGRFATREICYDPWRATQLAHQLANEGATVVEIRQTTQMLSAPMKELDAAVRSGRFHHDGNPVLSWCMANVTAKEDNKQNVFPVRQKENQKIDGAVALIMAMNRAIVTEPANEVSGSLVCI